MPVAGDVAWMDQPTEESWPRILHDVEVPSNAMPLMGLWALGEGHAGAEPIGVVRASLVDGKVVHVDGDVWDPRVKAGEYECGIDLADVVLAYADIDESVPTPMTGRLIGVTVYLGDQTPAFRGARLKVGA